MNIIQLNRQLIEVERLIASDGYEAKTQGMVLLRDLIATSTPRPVPTLRLVDDDNRFNNKPV
jgi:hypothetical protein